MVTRERAYHVVVNCYKVWQAILRGEPVKRKKVETDPKKWEKMFNRIYGWYEDKPGIEPPCGCGNK